MLSKKTHLPQGEQTPPIPVEGLNRTKDKGHANLLSLLGLGYSASLPRTPKSLGFKVFQLWAYNPLHLPCPHLTSWSSGFGLSGTHNITGPHHSHTFGLTVNYTAGSLGLPAYRQHHITQPQDLHNHRSQFPK